MLAPPCHIKRANFAFNQVTGYHPLQYVTACTRLRAILFIGADFAFPQRHPRNRAREERFDRPPSASADERTAAPDDEDFRGTYILLQHSPHIQTEHGIAWIRIVPCHQRSRRMGRSVPVFTHELPNPGGHVLVLLDAIARVLAVLPCQRRRSVLLPRTYAPLHGDARKRAIPAWLVLPYRSHILARRRSSTGDRRRLASRLGVGRLLHAVAAPVRQLRRGPRQP